MKLKTPAELLEQKAGEPYGGFIMGNAARLRSSVETY
jgi:hypothetical protein